MSELPPQNIAIEAPFVVGKTAPVWRLAEDPGAATAPGENFFFEGFHARPRRGAAPFSGKAP